MVPQLLHIFVILLANNQFEQTGKENFGFVNERLSDINNISFERS